MQDIETTRRNSKPLFTIPPAKVPKPKKPKTVKPKKFKEPKDHIIRPVTKSSIFQFVRTHRKPIV